MTGHLRELTRSEIEAVCDRQSVICREYTAEITRLRAELDAARAKALQIANDEAARADGEGPEALAAQATALRIAAAIRAMIQTPS